MNEFRYTDYWTEYGCKGDINKKMRGEYCFGKIFHGHGDLKISYKIRVYREFLDKHDNCCFLSRKQVANLLKQAQGIYPFRYHVSNAIHNGHDIYNIHLEIDGPVQFHKYILAWTRYVYEYPYNVFLLDAYKLKEEKQFRFTSISNLFNLCLACFPDYEIRNVHKIPDFGLNKFMTKAQINKELQTVDRINDVYHVFKSFWSYDLLPSNIEKYNYRDIEYWQNYYEKRKEVYLDTYNTYKGLFNSYK